MISRHQRALMKYKKIAQDFEKSHTNVINVCKRPRPSDNVLMPLKKSIPPPKLVFKDGVWETIWNRE